MKKVIILFLVSYITTSCTSLDRVLKLSVENDLIENIDVHIPKTFGTAFSHNLSKTVDLKSGDLEKYLDKVSALKINSLSYKIKDFTGNYDGTIVSGDIKMDTVVLDTFTNFNIGQAATSGAVFRITNPSVLSQIETIMLNNKATTIFLTGNSLSDEGTMNFKIEVSMNMTATIIE